MPPPGPQQRGSLWPDTAGSGAGSSRSSGIAEGRPPKILAAGSAGAMPTWLPKGTVTMFGGKKSHLWYYLLLPGASPFRERGIWGARPDSALQTGGGSPGWVVWGAGTRGHRSGGTVGAVRFAGTVALCDFRGCLARCWGSPHIHGKLWGEFTLRPVPSTAVVLSRAIPSSPSTQGDAVAPLCREGARGRQAGTRSVECAVLLTEKRISR